MSDLQRANPSLACRLRSFDSVHSAIRQMKVADNDYDSRMGDFVRNPRGGVQGASIGGFMNRNRRLSDAQQSSGQGQGYIESNIALDRRVSTSSSGSKRTRGGQPGFCLDDDAGPGYSTATTSTSGFSFSAGLRSREMENSAERGSASHQPNPNRGNNEYRVYQGEDGDGGVDEFRGESQRDNGNDDGKVDRYPPGVVGKEMMIHPVHNNSTKNKGKSNNPSNNNTEYTDDDVRGSARRDSRKRQRDECTNWEKMDSDRWSHHDNPSKSVKNGRNSLGGGIGKNSNNTSSSSKINQQKANTHAHKMKLIDLTKSNADNSNNSDNTQKMGKNKQIDRRKRTAEFIKDANRSIDAHNADVRKYNNKNKRNDNINKNNSNLSINTFNNARAVVLSDTHLQQNNNNNNGNDNNKNSNKNKNKNNRMSGGSASGSNQINIPKSGNSDRNNGSSKYTNSNNNHNNSNNNSISDVSRGGNRNDNRNSSRNNGIIAANRSPQNGSNKKSKTVSREQFTVTLD